MSKRKTLQEWQNEVDKIHNFEFEILETPISGHQIVKVLHKKCGNILNTSLRNQTKRYCTHCSNKKKKTKEDWQNLSDEVHNSEFEILEDINNGKEKIKILHKKCGNILLLTMNNHINHKNGCKKCAKNSLKSNEYWINKCIEIWGDEYEILEEVNNVWNKVSIRHKSCGNILKKDMSNLIHNKRGCNICSKKAYGEDYIKNYLDINNIKYIQQKSFDGLINPKTGRKLRVDFYLQELDIVIEVDGVQHYKSIKHWGGDKAYEEQLYRDKIKNDFFIGKLKLIRINNKKNKNYRRNTMSTITKKETELQVDEILSSPYRLILHNDPVNTFDWVIDCLIKVCGHEPEQASQCAHQVHFTGKCDVKYGDLETISTMKEKLSLSGLSVTMEIN